MSLLLLLCVGNATAKMDYPKLEKKFSNSPDKDKILNECKSYLQKMEGVLKDTAIYNTAKKKRIASLKKQLSAAKDYPTQFRLTMSLQQEYAILNLPTSLQYAIKARTLARENKVITDFYLATINEAALLVKGGYFKQSAALLESIPKDKLDDETLQKYYETLFDLNYEDGFVFPGELNKNDQFSIAMTSVYNETKKRFPENLALLTKMKMEYYFHIKEYAQASRYALKLLTFLEPRTENF